MNNTQLPNTDPKLQQLYCMIMQQAPVPHIMQHMHNTHDIDHHHQSTIAAAATALLRDACNLPYIRRLLTTLVQSLQHEPDDSIAEMLAHVLTAAHVDDGWRTKTFYYHHGAVSHTMQSLMLHTHVGLLEGATGCHEWEAGFRLAEVVLGDPHLVRGVCVVVWL